jgi:hypothetical protein
MINDPLRLVVETCGGVQCHGLIVLDSLPTHQHIKNSFHYTVVQ